MPRFRTISALACNAQGLYQTTRKEGDLRALFIAQNRVLALSVAEYPEPAASRNGATVAAYRFGAYTMTEIATHFGVHYMTVSGAVRNAKDI